MKKITYFQRLMLFECESVGASIQWQVVALHFKAGYFHTGFSLTPCCTSSTTSQSCCNSCRLVLNSLMSPSTLWMCNCQSAPLRLRQVGCINGLCTIFFLLFLERYTTKQLFMSTTQCIDPSFRPYTDLLRLSVVSVQSVCDQGEASFQNSIIRSPVVTDYGRTYYILFITVPNKINRQRISHVNI